MTVNAIRRNMIVTMSMHALDALGSPLRRDILLALREGPLSVGGLSDRFPVTRPAISRHLRLLEEAGLVERREEGTRHLYAVRVQGLRAVKTFLDSFWDVALGRLEALSRREPDKRPRKGTS
jgi:DNA-binding transcriptional ArsR family regulator